MAHNRRFNNQNDEKYDLTATQELQQLLIVQDDPNRFPDDQVKTLIRRGANPHILEQPHTLQNDGDVILYHPVNMIAYKGNADFLQDLFQLGLTPTEQMIKEALEHSSNRFHPRLRLPVDKIVAVIDAVLHEDPTLINKMGNYNNNESSLLIYAVKVGAPTEAIERLLHYGIDVDLQDSNGMTALMYASNSSGSHMMRARQGRSNVVDLLLRHGAEAHLENKEGRTARNVARTPNLKNKLPNRQGGKRSKRKTRRGKSRKSRKSRKTRRHRRAKTSKRRSH